MNVAKFRHAVRSLILPTVVLVAGSASLFPQTVNPGLALRGATIYPAPDTPSIRDGVVIIRNGRIDAVGAKSAIALPTGMPVLDLTGLTLVAGFWNSHVHFSEAKWAPAETRPAASLAEAFRDMLTRWGFTTVFDTGSGLENTLALRRRVESGAVDGPRIFTTGDILFPPGAPGSRYHLETPEEATAASQDLLDRGADALKVYAQTFWDLNLKLSPSVLTAVVTEAHRRGRQVFAHPSNRDGLDNAINAGVDALMHTTPQIGPWGSTLVATMKARNIALVPTLKLWRFELLKEKVPAPGIDQFSGRGIAQLREYFSAGGPILFGTDVGYMTDYSTSEEFEKMAQAGMGYRDILASLTTTPAARRGLAERAGKVAVGFDADLVALQTDPARDVSAFAAVTYTIRSGRVIYGAAARR
jgi:imidazolonepropionase-like amidohydrolase